MCLPGLTALGPLLQDSQFQAHLKEQGASLYKEDPAIKAMIDDPASFYLTTKVGSALYFTCSLSHAPLSS
jgi:hypothetical protein